MASIHLCAFFDILLRSLLFIPIQKSLMQSTSWVCGELLWLLTLSPWSHLPGISAQNYVSLRDLLRFSPSHFLLCLFFHVFDVKCQKITLQPDISYLGFWQTVCLICTVIQFICHSIGLLAVLAFTPCLKSEYQLPWQHYSSVLSSLCGTRSTHPFLLFLRC